MSKWHRVRFETTAADDPRPIVFPPPGPFWITGYGGNDDQEYVTIVAYFPEGQLDNVYRYWPEARNLDAQDSQSITFSDRFPKPDWWSA